MAVNGSNAFLRALIYGFLSGKGNMDSQQNTPLISIKEARKILGIISKDLTNEEILHLIQALEQIAYVNVKDFMVRKMVE